MEFSIFKIEAIIRPNRVEAVQESLREMDLNSLTVTEARGIGGRQITSHTFRGSQYVSHLPPISKVEVFVSADRVEPTLSAIREAAETGEPGDGKIFVTPVWDVMRVRTGERGSAALE